MAEWGIAAARRSDPVDRYEDERNSRPDDQCSYHQLDGIPTYRTHRFMAEHYPSSATWIHPGGGYVADRAAPNRSPHSSPGWLGVDPRQQPRTFLIAPFRSWSAGKSRGRLHLVSV